MVLSSGVEKTCDPRLHEVSGNRAEAIPSSCLVAVADADAYVDDAISETDGCDNAASCCLDERIDWDSQDEDNESSFRQCGCGCVWQDGHWW